MNTTILFALYLLIINLFGFAIMGHDKHLAIQGKWRISEKTLFTIALILGGVGIYLGMKKFRHKTQHKIFVYGIPCIIVLNFICIFYILKFLL
ncbi:putative membrane component [Clostridium sp. CAG:921]|nr:putative membrane component [Clostridium sp. CAG:921]